MCENHSTAQAVTSGWRKLGFGIPGSTFQMPVEQMEEGRRETWFSLPRAPGWPLFLLSWRYLHSLCMVCKMLQNGLGCSFSCSSKDDSIFVSWSVLTQVFGIIGKAEAKNQKDSRKQLPNSYHILNCAFTAFKVLNSVFFKDAPHHFPLSSSLLTGAEGEAQRGVRGAS